MAWADLAVGVGLFLRWVPLALFFLTALPVARIGWTRVAQKRGWVDSRAVTRMKFLTIGSLAVAATPPENRGWLTDRRIYNSPQEAAPIAAAASQAPAAAQATSPPDQEPAP